MSLYLTHARNSDLQTFVRSAGGAETERLELRAISYTLSLELEYSGS